MVEVKYRLFHYTTGERLFLILESGELKPYSIGLMKDDRPAVWFTTSPAWEEIANRFVRDQFGETRQLSMQETKVSAGGLVRIEVMSDIPTVSWEEFKKVSGIDTLEAEHIEQVASDLGSNIDRWRASFDPVPKSKWLQIQFWDGDRWRFKITD